MSASPQAFANRRGLASTHWTTIRACQATGSAGQAAREKLCRDYWYPLYAYIKRLGHQGCDAEDLTQAFFVEILRSSWLARADRSKGRFRSFLFASLDRFLRDRSAAARASKRAGTYQHIPLDLSNAESRYVQSAAARISPIMVYETEWAASLVDAAWQRLRTEYAEAGKLARFEQLKEFLTSDGDAGRHAAVAAVLGLSTATVKVNVHRLRKRYGAILREEVARTVASPGDVAEEMQHLRTAFEEKKTAVA